MRVIVADNASTDNTISFLKDHYPQITVLKNKINEGFAKGYNIALKQVEADYPWPVFKVLYNKELNWVRGLLVGIKAREILDVNIKDQYLSLLLPKRNFTFLDNLIVLMPHWIFRVLYKLYRVLRYQSL
jgi:glycosyltransferase involved in cell wall biosynthesis